MKQYIAGELKRRVAGSPKKQPLRTITELAEEFGVDKNTLRAYLGNRENAPKPQLKNKNNTWYKPIEFRKWWNSIAIRKE